MIENKFIVRLPIFIIKWALRYLKQTQYVVDLNIPWTTKNLDIDQVSQHRSDMLSIRLKWRWQKSNLIYSPISKANFLYLWISRMTVGFNQENLFITVCLWIFWAIELREVAPCVVNLYPVVLLESWMWNISVQGWPRI